MVDVRWAFWVVFSVHFFPDFGLTSLVYIAGSEKAAQMTGSCPLYMSNNKLRPTASLYSSCKTLAQFRMWLSAFWFSTRLLICFVGNEEKTCFPLRYDLRWRKLGFKRLFSICAYIVQYIPLILCPSLFSRCMQGCYPLSETNGQGLDHCHIVWGELPNQPSEKLSFPRIPRNVCIPRWLRLLWSQHPSNSSLETRVLTRWEHGAAESANLEKE